MHRVGVVHAAANTVAALLYLSSWRHRRRGAHLRGVLVGGVAGVVASVSGHLGGHMSFGLDDEPADRRPGASGAETDHTAEVADAQLRQLSEQLPLIART